MGKWEVIRDAGWAKLGSELVSLDGHAGVHEWAHVVPSIGTPGVPRYLARPR